MLNGLDLFSGIGGITLALSEWVRPVAYCEIDPFCQSVLLSRMQEGDLPKAPIWEDVRTLRDALFDSGLVYQEIDIITGGFPCQDISTSGRGKGLDGERSGLFIEILFLAEEIKPKFIFLENVPAITTRGGLRVVRKITALGYDCRWCVISAASVGACHKRDRWFLLAHTESTKPSGLPVGKEETLPRTRVGCEDVAHPTRDKSWRSSVGEKKRSPWSGVHSKYKTVDEWQEAVSTMGKFTDGISHRVDRLKALGNAVVPVQVREAFSLLSGLELK